jgi:hypothetical protein
MGLSHFKALYVGDAFSPNAMMTSGLSLFVNGGPFVSASQGLQSAPNKTLTLAASATNYVEVDDLGVISSNTSSFTSSKTSLFIITTGATQITDIQDCRELGGLNQLIDGAQLPNLAAANIVGVPPVIHRVDVAAGANASIDTVLTHKTRVIDSFLILRGAGVGSATLQVKNGATAITEAMAASGSAKALVRAATIDTAQWEIAAGGTLRVTGAGGASMPDATVYVIGVRVV